MFVIVAKNMFCTFEYLFRSWEILKFPPKMAAFVANGCRCRCHLNRKSHHGGTAVYQSVGLKVTSLIRHVEKLWTMFQVDVRHAGQSPNGQSSVSHCHPDV